MSGGRHELTEMSPEQAERSRAIWNELMARIDGPLPFVRVDPNNSKAVTALWAVRTTVRSPNSTSGIFSVQHSRIENLLQHWNDNASPQKCAPRALRPRDRTGEKCGRGLPPSRLSRRSMRLRMARGCNGSSLAAIENTMRIQWSAALNGL
jgi:hypothetical protein